MGPVAFIDAAALIRRGRAGWGVSDAPRIPAAAVLAAAVAAARAAAVAVGVTGEEIGVRGVAFVILPLTAVNEATAVLACVGGVRVIAVVSPP